MANYHSSRKSIKEYFDWRVDRVKPVVEKINRIEKLKGLKVLEVGCGYGALMSVLNDKGANVVGIEINQNSINVAKEFLKGRERVKIIKSKGEILSFKDSSFDIVILFDVIEHVRNPKKMMSEAIRVLKSGGLLYVEFTPFYSLTGHHLYDITKLPIHFLPESYIKRIVYRKKVRGIFTRQQYWQDYKSLNKMKISEFKSFVKNLYKLEERFIFKYPDTFEINLPILQYLGSLGEIFTLSFEGVYKKL